MKKLLLVLITTINFGFITNAQDIITLRNGEDIMALVQEISDLDVKYKRFDNPNGPNYTLKKTEIFQIWYANGSKEVFILDTGQPNVQRQGQTLLEPLSISGIKIYNSNGQQLSRVEIQNVMSNVPEALGIYNSGYRKRSTARGFSIPGTITACAGIAMVVVGIATEDEEVKITGGSLCVISIPLNIVATVLFSSGNARIRNSVATYNRGSRQGYTSNSSLNFGITQSGGLGLSLTF